MRGLFIAVLLGLLACTTLQAQWVERDSVWIQDVLGNGGEYQLNQETLDAIRNRTLLNTAPAGQFVLSPSGLPFSKDVEDIRNRQNMFRDLYILHLPSSGVMLYQPEPDSILVIRSALVRDWDDILIREYFRIPHSSIEISAPGADLDVFEFELINGEWEGNLRARTYATFSTEDALEDIFEPAERHKRQNRRDADAWKTYNLQDMDE